MLQPVARVVGMPAARITFCRGGWQAKAVQISRRDNRSAVVLMEMRRQKLARANEVPAGAGLNRRGGPAAARRRSSALKRLESDSGRAAAQGCPN
jgi:hypothetical protein